MLPRFHDLYYSCAIEKSYVLFLLISFEFIVKKSVSLICIAMSDSSYRNCPPASLIKQLAAMVYDSLLVFAVLFLATAIALIFNFLIFDRGEAIEPSPFFTLYLLLSLFTFYAWFWHKSGQTLGMRAWKIRIVSEFGGNPSWGTSYLRLMFALLSLVCFGLGYFWRLFKPYTWHDRLSQTSIIDVSSLTRAGKEADTGTV
jgi:uncharacterized RDD family membrane protein YckC